MRKRRRLANKMTIMVCAVLIAVSAFFYAPMNVYAQSVSEGQVLYSDNLVDAGIMPLASGANVTGSVTSGYYAPFNIDDYDFDFSPYFTQGEGLYKVSFSFNVTLTCNTSKAPFWVTPTSHFGFTETGAFSQSSLINSSGNKATVTYPCERVLYTTLDDTSLTVKHRGALVWSSSVGSPGSSFKVTSSYQVSNIVVEKVTVSDSQVYQNGYNAGYSAGEQAGYGNGYSEGYESGYSAGESAGYDKGVSDSTGIDVNSYYNAGYTAGYNVGYSEGYELGYDEGYLDGFENGVAEGEITGYEKGYEDALEYYTKGRVSNVPDFSKTGTFYNLADDGRVETFTEVPTNYDFVLDNDYNISFRVDTSYSITYMDNVSGTPTVSTNDLKLSLCGVQFDLNGSGRYSFDFSPSTTNNQMRFDYYLSALSFPSDWTKDWDFHIDYTFKVTDVVITSKTGRSFGEILEDMERQDLITQNTIKDGFSDSMNGFDNSQGNSVNSDLSSGLNEYQTSEDTLWATATTGLKDFTFFDFASVPAMITGMSFITAIMGSWFNQAGGTSGVGIVLSILFSVVLVAMVLGLYRWYQSRGGKD